MQRNLQTSSRLLMVTDTSMVIKDGKVYAFGPVVRELDVFHEIFSSIIWIGFKRTDLINDNSLLPVPNSVQCILLKSSGGNSLYKKFGVLFQIPKMFFHLLNNLFKSDVIHVRSPSSPAIIAIIVSYFFKNKVWWVKYAGNWGEQKPPFFYNLQRVLLRNTNFCKVTINGRWDNQPKHILTFENPCLSFENRINGKSILLCKNYKDKLNLCFVGHLTLMKGADFLLKALRDLSNNKFIGTVHIIGSGELLPEFINLCKYVNFEIILHGYISNSDVHEIMKLSHLLILPSRSEGFPKVIAEAANYGCIPVVTDISAIGQIVIDGFNGFLILPTCLEDGHLSRNLIKIFEQKNLKEIAINSFEMADLFTFQRYSSQITTFILNEC